MDENVSFGAWIKQRRKELDLTQEGLAEQAGCSVEMIRKVEGSSARPSRQLAELLAAALQVPTAQRPALVGWARSGKRDGGQAAEPHAAVVEEGRPQNPYKGLRSFQESDAADFFGREALAEQLLARLGEESELARFLAVVGPSGSGKSSVVRAGLVPALRRGGLPLSERWPVLEIVPGARPLEELEAALLRVAVNPPASLLAQLREDERGLLRAVKRTLPNSEGGLLLVLDQFEEVFTLVEDDNARAHFLDSLYAAVTDPRSPVRVVATLRADFYDRPLLYRRPGELLRRRTEVVLPMSAGELERAIVRPAERAGVALEPDLLATIIRDVGEQPGALPLLQYSLTELFERREGGLLTLRAYHASGGVAGALARRAEEIYAGLPAEEQEVARQLFLRLVTLGEGVEDTRRRVRAGELVSAMPDEQALHRVLDIFGRYRLLTFDRDPLGGGPTVEVAHEALLRVWPRLREWLAATREGLRVQRRLHAAAGEWLAGGRDPSFLAPGTRLAQFESLAAEGDILLNAAERAYVEASLAERERQTRAERARQERELALQRRAATRLRYLVGALALFLVVAAALSLSAFLARGQAEQNLARSEALRLAAEANTLLQAGQAHELMALLSIRSVRTLHTPQGDATLEPAAAFEYPLRRFVGHSGPIFGLAVSPDGKTLATASWDRTARLWDLAGGRELRSLAGHEDRLQKLAFSPDGRTLLTGSLDGTARLWDVATGRQLRVFSGHEDAVSGVALSPDGRYLLTGSGDKTARLWEVAGGQEVRRFTGHTALVSHVAFSPDGGRVLTSSEDRTARLWDARTGEELRVFTGHEGSIWTSDISPDGKTVLTGSDDRTARLWDAESGQELWRFEGHRDYVNAVAFAPDGEALLTGSSDGTIRLWDRAGGPPLRTLAGHNGPVLAAAISPDGRYVLGGGFEQTALLWDVGQEPDLPRFVGHSRGLTDGAFSADGRFVLTVSLDKTARLWDAHTGAELQRFSGHADGQTLAALRPDGKTVLTASADGILRFWDAAGGQELRQVSWEVGVPIKMVLSPDAKYLLVGGEDKTARLLDAATGQELRLLGGHERPVVSVSFSPDSKYLLTGSLDGTALIWDAGGGANKGRLDHGSPVHAVAFSPDGRMVLTGGEDKSARLWDADTGQELRVFTGHAEAITAVAFSADRKTILTGSVDGTARLWDVATGGEVRRLTGHEDSVEAVSFSPDGKRVLTGAFDGTARLWHVNYRDTLRDLCARLLRDFADDERRRYALPDKSPTCDTPGK